MLGPKLGKHQLKSWLYKCAGIFISVLFLYLAVRQVDLSESARVLSTVRPGWLVAATLVYLSNFPFRALRWRRILWNHKALSLKEILVPVMVGHMANNVLPARSGEIYRGHFLGRRTQMSSSSAVGSIVVERTFDGLMLVVVLLLVFLLFPQAHFLGGAALLTGLVFLVLAASILFYSFATEGANRMINRLLGLLPQKLKGFIALRLRLLLQGMRALSSAREHLQVASYTVLIWFLEAAAVALVITSFNVTLPLSGYFLVFALIVLSTTLPSGPGYVGPYQYAFVLALGFFAVSREMALTISVAAHLILLGSITVIGLVLLWREQLRPKPSTSRAKPELRKERVG
jgi:glycosyltransferase 2 family protein